MRYTTGEFSENCLNVYKRFPPNSRLVAYVVTENTSKNTMIAMQYAPPMLGEMTQTYNASSFKEDSVVPQIEEMASDVDTYRLPNGQSAICGKTRYGLLLRSRRSYSISMIDTTNKNEGSYTFYACSPTKGNQESFDFDMRVERFKETDEANCYVQEHAMSCENGEIILNEHDISEREKVTSRTPDQNCIMGKSAVSAAKLFYEQHESILSDELKNLIKTGYEAIFITHIKVLKDAYKKLSDRENILNNLPFSDSTVSELNVIDQEKKKIHVAMNKIILEAPLRFEWLHGESYTNTPLSENPQRKENLGAAMAWVNTKMMIFERVARWFEIHEPVSVVKTYHQWEKFFHSHLLNHISFFITIQIGCMTIRLSQQIDPYLKNPEYVKTSDIAGLIHVIYMLIQHIAPISTKPVNIRDDLPKTTSQFQMIFFQNQNKKRERSEELDTENSKYSTT